MDSDRIRLNLESAGTKWAQYRLNKMSRLPGCKGVELIDKELLMANMKLMREDSKRIIEQDSKRPKMTLEEWTRQFKALHSDNPDYPKKPETDKKKENIEQED